MREDPTKKRKLPPLNVGEIQADSATVSQPIAYRQPVPLPDNPARPIPSLSALPNDTPPVVDTPPNNEDAMQSIALAERQPDPRPLPSLEDNYQGQLKKISAMQDAPPEKQKWWKEGLNLAFQTIEKIFTPNDRPIQFLGEAQKQRRIQEEMRKLPTLEAGIEQQRRT